VQANNPSKYGNGAVFGIQISPLYMLVRTAYQLAQSTGRCCILVALAFETE